MTINGSTGRLAGYLLHPASVDLIANGGRLTLLVEAALDEQVARGSSVPRERSTTLRIFQRSPPR